MPVGNGQTLLINFCAEEVEQRIERTHWHRQLALTHALIFVPIFILSLISSVPSHSLLNGFFFAFLWFYIIFIPHILALVIYQQRWNASTYRRKKKLDAADQQYNGGYDLDPDAQYGVDAEGELVKLLANPPLIASQVGLKQSLQSSKPE